MKREITNIIRWVMEDVMPPVLRDSPPFAWLMSRAYGPLVHDLAAFRQRAHALTPQEYDALYRRLPRVHEETDNSDAILAAIAAHVVPGRIADIGCGTGYTLGRLSARPELKDSQFTGVDFQISDSTRARWPNLTLTESAIEHLPFPDGSFDTVLCTHTLEHILDVRQAVAELRRICRKRLILVVPREREGIYTFNPHFHFFPYVHSFLRVMIPVPSHYHAKDIGRDIFYWEDRIDG
jgi:ubiquinone/menaquinone biosynthesis C-methylase UbiE